MFLARARAVGRLARRKMLQVIRRGGLAADLRPIVSSRFRWDKKNDPSCGEKLSGVMMVSEEGTDEPTTANFLEAITCTTSQSYVHRRATCVSACGR